MSLIRSIFQKRRFDRVTDRIGPDIPFTHWRLFFNKSMVKLCSKKFKVFGKDASFRPGAYAIGCSKIEIGDNVVIRPGTMLFGDSRDDVSSIIIEDKVLIGSGVHVYVNNHRFNNRNIPIFDQGHLPVKPVRIKKGSWIGANAIILPGVEIGENCVIGAGAIVTKSVPDHVIAVGNPAKVISKIQ